MRHRLSIQILLAVPAFFALVLMSAPHASAEVATSSSFNSRSTVNSFGGNSTSTSFSSVHSGDQTGGGESTSSSFTMDAGFLYFDSFTPKQQNWRWYDDETSETPTSALSSENVSPANVAEANPVKLRVTVAEIADFGESNVKLKLQFATSSDFSTGARDVVEQGSCTGTSVWCYADGAGIDNGIITTRVLTDSDSCASSLGDGCGTHNESGTTTSTFTHKKSTKVEYEFTLVESGASANTVYFFRLYDNTAGAAIPFNSGKTYPSVSTTGTSLTFTIGGLSSSTLTSGITTTVDATSVAVPFGTLAISAPQTGAQRLTVTTNAAQGYEIFAYAQQDLIGSSANIIPPVAGTNLSPVGWSAGCTTSATGCYGYHTSDAVLAGGSTRFAADDTYAQFSTTSLNEVAYSSTPVSGRATDVVYKVEVHDDQSAGSYSTNVVYIVVPTF